MFKIFAIFQGLLQLYVSVMSKQSFLGGLFPTESVRDHLSSLLLAQSFARPPALADRAPAVCQLAEWRHVWSSVKISVWKCKLGGTQLTLLQKRTFLHLWDSHLGGEVITGLHAHGVFNYRISVLLRAKPSLMSQSVPLPTQELPYWLPNGLLL